MNDSARPLGGANAFFVGLAVFLLALYLLKPAPWLLVYDRVAVSQGEIWRLLSGAAVHVSGVHLALNLVGLALIWLLFGFRLSSGEWWFAALFTAVVGGALGFVVNPDLRYSLGASGLLHGLLAAGCLAEIRQRGPIGYLVLAILVAKILAEQFSDVTTARWLANPVNVHAHWQGAAAGGGALLLLAVYTRLRQRR
ncbi:MAG: rhombosortase [Chromatiales bacterium]|nr:rhombosortase [Chromatiales bacterium]